MNDSLLNLLTFTFNPNIEHGMWADVSYLDGIDAYDSFSNLTEHQVNELISLLYQKP